jgi:hypothetical protein
LSALPFVRNDVAACDVDARPLISRAGNANMPQCPSLSGKALSGNALPARGQETPVNSYRPDQGRSSATSLLSKLFAEHLAMGRPHVRQIASPGQHTPMAILQLNRHGGQLCSADFRGVDPTGTFAGIYLNMSCQWVCVGVFLLAQHQARALQRFPPTRCTVATLTSPGSATRRLPRGRTWFWSTLL